jgi:hypothetical protein
MPSREASVARATLAIMFVEGRGRSARMKGESRLDFSLSNTRSLWLVKRLMCRRAIARMELGRHATTESAA